MANGGEGVADLPHGMFREGHVRKVGGEGVPPGDEGRVPQAVPENPQAFALAADHTKLE